MKTINQSELDSLKQKVKELEGVIKQIEDQKDKSIHERFIREATNIIYNELWSAEEYKYDITDELTWEPDNITIMNLLDESEWYIRRHMIQQFVIDSINKSEYNPYQMPDIGILDVQLCHRLILRYLYNWWREHQRKDQRDLNEELVSNSGINIVTCGTCGEVFLHRVGEQELTCPYCMYQSDPCDFPDLIS